MKKILAKVIKLSVISISGYILLDASYQAGKGCMLGILLGNNDDPSNMYKFISSYTESHHDNLANRFKIIKCFSDLYSKKD